jgi:hypothetical protein
MQIAELEAVKMTIQPKKSFRRLELSVSKIDTQPVQTAGAHQQRNREIMIDLS